MSFSAPTIDTPQWRIRAAHENVESAAKDVLYWAQVAGKELQAQKDRMAHGEWLPWLEQHVPFSESTAHAYMRVYKGREQLKQANSQPAENLSLAGALKLLSAPKPKKPAPEAPKPWSERDTTALLREQTPQTRVREEGPVSGDLLPPKTEWTDAQRGKYQRAVQHADELRSAIGQAVDTQGFGAKDHLTTAANTCRRLASQLDDLAASF